MGNNQERSFPITIEYIGLPFIQPFEFLFILDAPVLGQWYDLEGVSAPLESSLEPLPENAQSK